MIARFSGGPHDGQTLPLDDDPVVLVIEVHVYADLSGSGRFDYQGVVDE